PSKSNATTRVRARWMVARENIDVTSHDLNDVVVNVPAYFGVTGHIVSDAVKPPVSTITLEPIGDDRLFAIPRRATVGEKGAFTISDCEPLKYVVRLGEHPGMYVDRIEANGQD